MGEPSRNFSDIMKIRSPDFSLSSAKDIPIIPGHHRVGDVIPTADSRHTLILTTWRSGSTFLGDLLNQYPGTFYYFEPLHYYANNINSRDKMSKADFLESLFRCKFDRRNFGYLEHVARWSNTFLFKNHNFRLWNSCQVELQTKVHMMVHNHGEGPLVIRDGQL